MTTQILQSGFFPRELIYFLSIFFGVLVGFMMGCLLTRQTKGIIEASLNKFRQSLINNELFGIYKRLEKIENFLFKKEDQ